MNKTKRQLRAEIVERWNSILENPDLNPLSRISISWFVDLLTDDETCETPIDTQSRWYELFGTPERAAEYFAVQCFGSDSSMCCYCPFDGCDGKLRNSGAYPSIYEALLEWFKQEVS